MRTRTVLCVLVLFLSACHQHSPVSPTPIPAPTYPASQVEIVTFAPTAQQVSPGELAYVTIVTKWAESCSIEDVGSVPCAGVIKLPVDDDSREHGWTLHAKNSTGEAVAHTSVQVRLYDVVYRIEGVPTQMLVQLQTAYGVEGDTVVGTPYVREIEQMPKGAPLMLHFEADYLRQGGCMTLSIWADRVVKASQSVCGTAGPASATIRATY